MVWSDLASDRYGRGYRFTHAKAMGYTATYTPDIPKSGQYEVYAWWTEGFWRTPLTQFEIRHSDGSDIVSWNQGINGGKWNLLGTYWFDEGIEGYVVITDVPADEPMLPVVIADAVMFKPVD